LLRRAHGFSESPYDAWALGRLGKLRGTRGDWEGAVESFEDAVGNLTSLPAEKDILSNVLVDYARALRALGDVAEAEELGREAELRK